MNPDTTAKRAAFRRLHEAGCFVLPNPWDVGSREGAAVPGLQGARLHQRRLWPGRSAGRTGG